MSEVKKTSAKATKTAPVVVLGETLVPGSTTKPASKAPAKATPAKSSAPKAEKAPVAKVVAPKAVAPKVEKAPAKPVKSTKPAGKAPYETNGEIRVTMIHGMQGCTKRQIRTMMALGMKKIGDTKIHKDNPAIRGMCRLTEHLVKVEKI